MVQNIRNILLFICCFTLPMAAFSLFDIGTFGMSPFKLTTTILLAVVAVEFTLSKRRAGHDPMSKWIGLYAVALTVAFVQGFLRGLPAEKLVPESTTYYAIILFYFIIRFAVSDLRSLRTVLWGLVLGGVATGAPAVLGLQQATDLGRFTGLAGQENVLGHDMAFVIPAAIALFVGRRSGVGRIVLVGAIFIATGALLLSLSRTAFVAALAMWGLWILRSGRLDTVWYLIPGVAILIGVVFLAPAQVAERVETITDSYQRRTDGSIQERLHQFEFATKAFVASPLTGVGLLNFLSWSRAHPEGRRVQGVVHSSYLSVLAEQGLLGFVPYVMILGVSWTQYGQARRAARKRRSLRDRDLAELAGYALFLQIALFGGLIEGFASIMQKSKAMWLIIALGPVLRGLVAKRIQELEVAPAGLSEPSRWDERLTPSPGAGTAWSS